MSWTHSSKILVAAVLIAVSLGAAGTAAAVTFTADDPEPVEVGETVTFDVEMEDVYEQGDQWTLEGETELEGAAWEIVAYDVAGDEIDRASDPDFEVDREEGDIDRIEIQVQGDVPEIENYDYENIEEEEFLLMGLSQADGPTLEEWHAHRYTEESREAREKIDEAADKVDDEDDLDSVIALYNSGEFEQAINDAQSLIDDAESEEQTQQLLLIGGAVVVLLILAGGGYYVYQQRSQDTHKLQ